MTDISGYRLVIFDLDGTLLDTLDDLTDSVNFALNSEGFPKRSRDEIRSFVGNGIRRLIDSSLPENTDEEAAERVFSLFKEYYAMHNADKTRPYDGILPLLDELKKRGVRLALVSNKADFAVKALAERYFNGTFDAVLGERENIPRKPDPASVNEVLRLLSAKKEDAVYVGDSDVDILTAKNAELDCICVTWGFRDKEYLKECGGALFADTAHELMKIITE